MVGGCRGAFLERQLIVEKAHGCSNHISLSLGHLLPYSWVSKDPSSPGQGPATLQPPLISAAPGLPLCP